MAKGVDGFFKGIWNNNKYFITILGLIIVLIVVFRLSDGFVDRLQNFFNAILGNANAPKRGKLTSEEKAIIRNSGFNAKAFATSFHSVIDGWNTSNTQRIDMFFKLNNLSDIEIISVVSEFEKMYSSDEYFPTMRAAIAGESATWTDLGVTANAFQKAKNQVLNRLDNLGLY